MIKDLLQEAFALKASGHYKHAIEIFYKALELDNSSSELLLEIADLYDRIGNKEKALSYIEQILDKDPTHIDALKFLKRVFERKEAWQEAEQTAKNIYCISHNSADLAEIFKLLIKQNKFDALANLYYSEKHYKKALEELEGNFFEARFLKAVILYETGYLALARKELSELALEFPNKEMVSEYMTRINSELGLN